GGADAAEERAAAGQAAVGVCGAVALNFPVLAASGTGSGEEALREAFESSLELAIKALRHKRAFVAALSRDPGSPLYRVCAGARPLVAGERGWDLVHLVGVETAVRLGGASPAEAVRRARRLASYATVRASEEGARVRLRVRVAPDPRGEAARRFLEADRRRSRAIDDALPGPEHEAYPGHAAYGRALPPTAAPGEALYDPVGQAVQLRFARDDAPATAGLYDALLGCAQDPRVAVFRPAPWPDRRVLRPS
ncbi:MAG: hypothetical protein ACE5JG_08820, partial [Planctomycetota bacterium]